MHTITDAELLQYSHKGFIPGPEESETEYLRRIHYCLEQCNPLPLKGIFSTDPHLREEAASQTRELFGIDPQWVSIIFSNQQLAPWHGGCAWIFQETSESPVSAFLQLRKAFAASSFYLGIYHRTEIIAHEFAHVGRMLFHEPRFEELLAYRTSTSRFRRWFGPLISNSYESLFFILSLFLGSGTLLLNNMGNLFLPKALLILLQVIPFLLLGAGLIRLWHRHTTFNRCLNLLKACTQSERTANALIFRLCDREILLFSKMNPLQLREYIQKQCSVSLRWREIGLLFKERHK